MDFTGFSQNKRSLYSEMKIFVTKKGSSFGIRPIVAASGNQSLCEEAVPMIPTGATVDRLGFYFELKRLRTAFNAQLAQTRVKVAVRVKTAFDTPTAQDEEVQRMLSGCYTLIRSFEARMREHRTDAGSPDHSAAARFDRAVCLHLNGEFSRMVKQLKKEEQKFFAALRGKRDQAAASFFDFIHDNHLSEDKRVVYSDKGEKMVLTELGRQGQSEDLARMLEQINSLTDLLARINDMVVEQGTLVDRIDVNLQEALVTTQRANVELQQVKDEMDKGCAARLLRYLIIANLLVFLLLLLKFR